MRKSEITCKIACVIVTYNRKQLLEKCIKAVCEQTFKPVVVYIVDNASTDGTNEDVTKWGFYETNVFGISFHYLLLPNNQGGAGGFYAGMKAAMESGYDIDGVWVMDDDGEPEARCLEYLTAELGHHHFIAPRVIDINDRKHLAFNYYGSFNIEDEDSVNLDGLIGNRACPMNGILFSASLVRKIGYPIKEMFIWGDERNYSARCVKVGANPITVAKAIHYHPKDRNTVYKTLIGSIIYVEQKWKAYCLYRNKAYNYKQRLQMTTRLDFLKYCMKNVAYIIFYRHNIHMTYVFCRATLDGLRGKWGGHYKYMK